MLELNRFNLDASVSKEEIIDKINELVRWANAVDNKNVNINNKVNTNSQPADKIVERPKITDFKYCTGVDGYICLQDKDNYHQDLEKYCDELEKQLTEYQNNNLPPLTIGYIHDLEKAFKLACEEIVNRDNGLKAVNVFTGQQLVADDYWDILMEKAIDNE